jgi:hypothetical protein
METRKPQAAQSKFSELPKDYAQMVNQVFMTNFDSGLKALKKMRAGEINFTTGGRIYPDEVLLCVSILFEGQLAATTVHASMDYDPKASTPTIQDLLAACVDGVGAVFSELFGEGKPADLSQILDQSLAAMKDVPFHWTEMKIDRFKVFLKVDKTNPALDAIAETWLEKHDPELKATRTEEVKATEGLFVTGPKPGVRKN